MKSKESIYRKGTLWSRVVNVSDRALKSGALQPILTKATFASDEGIDFMVRVVSNLARKRKDKEKHQAKKSPADKGANPFLPYETQMFVADISDTHLCLLNKFNVIEHHLLIVTRVFEDQRSLLNVQDFLAIWKCMAEFDALAFYNGGEEAGASQPHKHLQMIPLPMADRGPRVPIESLLHTAVFNGELGKLSGLPFRHSFMSRQPVLVQHPEQAARITHRHYRNMLQAVGLNGLHEPDTALQSAPYNLLFTREWMLLVPRSQEFFESISINALGYAGALLVQNERQLKALKQTGPMTILKHTALP